MKYCGEVVLEFEACEDDPVAILVPLADLNDRRTFRYQLGEALLIFGLRENSQIRKGRWLVSYCECP